MFVAGSVMLSICIPIYNFDVTSLLEDLHEQSRFVDFPVEIVCIDDCSEIEFKNLNRRACEKGIYIELEQNIGRSKIRNMFLKYANYNKLLFLDCDAKVKDQCFLQNYADLIRNDEAKVIFGGSIYEEKRPERKFLLAWKYGFYRQTKHAEERKKNPYQSFMTNNFMVNRVVFEKIRFDENITQYGHEDTLFGIELKEHGIPIIHAQNPVYHIGIDANARYLEKVETAIRSLIFIQKTSEYAKQFESGVTLIKTYKKLERKKLLFPLKVFYFLFRKPMRYFLKKGFVNLKMFDVYKLGYYASLIR